MKNKHRLRNTFIGAGVGAGAGAAIGASWNNGFFARGVAAAVYGGGYFVPGAVVGALVPDHTRFTAWVCTSNGVSRSGHVTLVVRVSAMFQFLHE